MMNDVHHTTLALTFSHLSSHSLAGRHLLHVALILAGVFHDFWRETRGIMEEKTRGTELAGGNVTK